MEIDVQRDPSRNLTTFGVMQITDAESALFLFTLEDEVRAPGVKVPGETAISAGRFPVTITRSSTFKKYLPLINGVPDFDGVRIHSLNNRKQTRGCIGVGFERADEEIERSRAAMVALMNKIARRDGEDADGVERWVLKEETWIHIRDAA